VSKKVAAVAMALSAPESVFGHPFSKSLSGGMASRARCGNKAGSYIHTPFACAARAMKNNDNIELVKAMAFSRITAR
jgi:hypothetical protein